ncbi:MAG: DUF1697 domain-containing protein [Saprospiraceae bacterium]|nr:DUF1697 domain-containing protein [Saprospiraceae bacterium]
MVYVILLRGINVSGVKKVKMAELRTLLSEAGLQDVQTYIQSGNIVAKSNLSLSAVQQKVYEVIAAHFGFEVPVQVFEDTMWLTFVKSNPFLTQYSDNQKALHLTVLAETPNLPNPFDVNTTDAWQQVERCIYLYCPNGYGRTKLTNGFWEKKTGLKATTRNWKTVLTIANMIEKARSTFN